jgi:hypothetical protein
MTIEGVAGTEPGDAAQLYPPMKNGEGQAFAGVWEDQPQSRKRDHKGSVGPETPVHSRDDGLPQRCLRDRIIW